MKIDQHTRISALIKQDIASIDAIASIAKPFQKLKNPILRKLFASRVNIEEAAKIGHCAVEDFKRVLVPLGFEWIDDSDPATRADEQDKPPWLNQQTTISILDVRPILQASKDPLKDIFKAYNMLPDQGILCVVNTFIPFPLIHRLKEKGAQAHVETIDPNEINTYFFKNNTAKIEEPPHEQVIFVSFDTLEQKESTWEANKIIRTDVTKFSMPQPMEIILGLLNDLQQDEVLSIRHKKIPLYLLEELVDKDYKVYICEKDEGDVRILIHALKD